MRWREISLERGLEWRGRGERRKEDERPHPPGLKQLTQVTQGYLYGGRYAWPELLHAGPCFELLTHNPADQAGRPPESGDFQATLGYEHLSGRPWRGGWLAALQMERGGVREGEGRRWDEGEAHAWQGS